MLGRLESGQMHPLSASAISGSIEAWGQVADDPAWAGTADLRDRLYEQVRRWYQLLLLRQDPTTLVRPYAKLSSPHGIRRALRLYRPQILIGFAALALIVIFFVVRDRFGSGWIPSLIGAIGVGGVALTGLFARAKNTAERLATRMKQDAYTDLVAVAVASVPDYPGAADRSRRSRDREQDRDGGAAAGTDHRDRTAVRRVLSRRAQRPSWASRKASRSTRAPSLELVVVALVELVVSASGLDAAYASRTS